MSVFALAASGSHVVRSGDTLSSIASRHGTTVRELVEANRIADPDRILVGQKLTIPGAGAAPGAGTEQREPATYTVRRGDTLATIAARFGTTVRAIAEANGIANPNLIRAGARLAVAGPGGGTAPSTGGAAEPGADEPSQGLSGQRHTVRIGDTIAGIARRYGISSADLIRWNGLVDGRIYATTRLLLYNPGNLPSLQTETGSGTHTVQAGETLSSIAARYGVRTSAIVSASGLNDPNRLTVGQELTIPGGGSTSLRCPVPGASFFNDWAFPRSGGRSHAGNDLFAPRGTPVLAPVSGHVDIATGSIGGKQFRLTAADGSRWYGSHLDAFGATGQVRAGDVIGYVGDSGNARGSRPHLHFELHVGDHPVNPYPLLRTVC